MNGRIHDEVKDPLESPAQLIQERLALLDGTRRYSLSLWRLPDGVPFDRVDLRSWPQEYVQVAGSRERMTIEVRRLEAGTPCQYVIGHPALGGRADPREVIAWDGCKTTVLESEVFDAAEAADVMACYHDTGGVPCTYRLRRLDL
jgi:hypothetical protein